MTRNFRTPATPRLSRRAFLGGTVAVPFVAAGVAGVLSAPALAQDAAGTLRVLLAPEARLVPGQLRAGGSANVASMIYDWLFRLEGNEQTFVHSLAESSSHSDDYKSWTIVVRKGVSFHHGTELTAKDVVFSIERHGRKEIGSPLANIFAHIESVTAADDHTVEVALSRPDPDFLLKFLDKNAAIIAHDYDYDNLGDSNPSGTGAFKVDEYVPSQYMRLSKNPDYFVEGLPKSDRIEIRFVSDVQTQMLSLEAGQADIVRSLPFDFFERYKDREDLTIHQVKSAYLTPITMRCDQPPFDDVRVRKAMKLVVDRQKMLEQAAFGLGVVANDDYVWSGFPWHSPQETKQRNVEEARRLLAEAGHPNGISVEIVCESNRPPVLETVLMYQQMAKEAGIDVKVNAVTTDIYYARYFMNAPVTCESWGHRDALDLLAVSVKTGAAWNAGRYSNARVDELLDLTSAEGDLEKRRALAGELQQILSEEGPAIVPFFHDSLAVSRAAVDGFVLTENWINDYRYAVRTA